MSTCEVAYGYNTGAQRVDVELMGMDDRRGG